MFFHKKDQFGSEKNNRTEEVFLRDFDSYVDFESDFLGGLEHG